MKIRILLPLLLSFTSICFSQKVVLKYPIEFTKGTLQKRDYDSYYLNDPVSQNSVMVLKDNKKAEYLLLDKNMKVVSKFSPSDGLSNTVFKFQEEYIGGTAGDGKFYFLYAVINGSKPAGIYLETVDPTLKTVSNRELFDNLKDEKSVATFGNYVKFFSIAADNKADEIKLYGLNSDGKSFIKSIKVNIPESSKKKK